MKTEILKIDPQNPDLEKIKQAALVIKEGGIVAVPTETVYGLAADFTNKQAVERIFEVKKRPKNKALTVQIKDITYLTELVAEVPFFAYQLMSKFWPGPLTLVLKAKSGGTIGLRMPANKIAQELIEQTVSPIVVPSANLSGEPEAKTAEEVLEVFEGLIDVVIDGGPVELGISSTVLDLTSSPYKVLREGSILKEDIQSVQG